jgi:hypothetical protein
MTFQTSQVGGSSEPEFARRFESSDFVVGVLFQSLEVFVLPSGTSRADGGVVWTVGVARPLRL